MSITTIEAPSTRGTRRHAPDGLPPRQKILVTGGCGFLGSHVCELFKSWNWEVLSYDNLTKFEYNRAGFKDEIRDYNLHFLESIGVPNIIADIRDLKMLTKAARGANLIANCAAQPAMTIAMEQPQLDFETNVQGVLNVLEAARRNDSAIINCSTVHVYGNNLNTHLLEEETRLRLRSVLLESIDEGEPTLKGFVSPLHASKLSAEHYVQAYVDTYRIHATNFRLTGIYGPRQFGGEDHGWVANFTIRTMLNRPIKVFGTDKQVRDILYVKDAAQAFYDWYEAGCPTGTYNIGGGPKTSISIQELLDCLSETGWPRSPVERLSARQGDLWWFVSDCAKAKGAFGWEATTLPLTGLAYLTEWIEKERSLFE